MIVTENFVYIHVHRSAGQFALRFIRKFYTPILFEGYHFPLAALPDEFSELPVIGLVRPPLDWYPSWYHFNFAQARNLIFPIVSGFGRADMTLTLKRLVELGQDSAETDRLLRMIMPLLPETRVGNRGAGITRADLKSLAGSGTGYYSWLVAHMFNAFPRGRCITTQAMTDAGSDLRRLWQRAGITLSAAMNDYLASAPRCNHSSPGVRTLDAELVRRVMQLDHPVFELLAETGGTSAKPNQGKL